MTPGTKSPWAKRQKMRACRLGDVAASRVGTARAKSAGTMTFLRPMVSAIRPVIGAMSATASVMAPTVMLTSISEAWNRRWK